VIHNDTRSTECQTEYWSSVCSHMVRDCGSILHKGGDLGVLKVVSFLLIPPPIRCKYVVLSPVLNGLIYNANHLLATTADV
jgi:hypothetical protein